MKDLSSMSRPVNPASAFVSEIGSVLSPETLFLENEPLSRKTTLGVGGPARFYSEPASTDDLRGLLRAADRHGIRVLVLGRGSNVLVPDEGVDALVLRLQHPCWRRIDVAADGRVRAGAGVRLRKLCGEACRRGLAGLEFLEGIPGTVGGALRMNAGAMGGWFFDVVEEVRIMAWNGEARVYQREELHYGYRLCRELLDSIGLEVVLAPPGREAAEQIRRRLVEYQQRRNGTQPKDSSAGCIFKNPDGDFAGRLIDELGLKGARVGDAEVSALHGNFIVNRGEATATDVIELVRRLRSEVRRQKNLELEPEVLLFGKEWRDVL